ncbi:hypothetical protein KIK06_28060 [Nocardiopsis sp. EMB25]|uniref:hypothetical protein n=1 Tax=Nocardiopsis sp. EMB25 TaxID=2835867 RepID=UPI0022842F1D|nr:hypothetical protein [Nocardiopsis sp. EMB25]MCY9787739.1 hypothetical protein [Nocardiopsis sp. EMB25]
MPNSLSERAQRLVFIGLIVALVAFGLYFTLGGFGGGDDAPEEPSAAPEEARSGDNGAGEPSSLDDLSTVEPSPITTTDEDDVDVLTWFPFEEAELREAGATARAFAEAYGTIDYSQSPEAYFGAMEELATDEYAEILADTSRVGAFWEEMSEAEAVAEGRAEVDRVRTFGEDSITFVLTAQSITETGDAQFDENLGEFAVTVVREGGTWLVFDFQPADVGQFGEE